ncbi:hypothetical protein HPB50_018267 [Hyalomma asiaticum]|uniref:Uncharacterized protein n=1 Tax=Hyalomma asiaticum TaxID=266040 RepID=A0ACB7SGD8_HYAAI|nr:hypothetical protein HPB50_018267 [Hyalomma asiaticum]
MMSSDSHQEVPHVHAAGIEGEHIREARPRTLFDTDVEVKDINQAISSEDAELPSQAISQNENSIILDNVVNDEQGKATWVYVQSPASSGSPNLKRLENDVVARYVIFDTPGQIEVFTWSASGNIITETLASEFPTVVVYVMDMVRSVNPVTFMSNMLYACSILYRTKLPFIVAMNKVDVVDHQFAVQWMQDFEAFQDALQGETSHISNLSRSLSYVLDEFYANLNTVGVSAVTGKGVHEFIEALQKARHEYDTVYRPEYEQLKKKKEEASVADQRKQLERLRLDVAEGDSVPLTGIVCGGEDSVDVQPGLSDEEDSEEEHPMDDEGSSTLKDSPRQALGSTLAKVEAFAEWSCSAAKCLLRVVTKQHPQLCERLVQYPKIQGCACPHLRYGKGRRVRTPRLRTLRRAAASAAEWSNWFK